MQFYRKDGKVKNTVVLLCFLIASLLLYAPVLNKYLASDDFMVMKRVALDKVVFIKGFFRPLSDITLYFSYWLGGFNAVYYNVFNIVAHAFCSFFLFMICRRSNLSINGNNEKFAWLSAILFLCYPFHNEAVIWGVGRASILASFFGAMSLLVVAGYPNQYWKYFLSAVFYFVALSAYESVIFIPAIVVILLWLENKGYKYFLVAGVSFSIALLAHFIVRILISGNVVGDYASGMLKFSLIKFLEKFIKAVARLFLPPMWNSMAFGFFTAVIFIVLVYIIYKAMRNLNRKVIYGLSLMLGFSLAAPVMFSVSTRTSESDRMLYFPSFFLCLIVSYLIYSFKISSFQRKLVITFLIIYSIVFLQINNSNWSKASLITKEILGTIKAQANGNKHMIVLNIPNEYKGAFIFQNGFNDALIIHKIDTSFVLAASYIDIEQYHSLSPTIKPESIGDTIIVRPAAKIWYNKTGKNYLLHISGKNDVVVLDEKDEIWYWNKEKLVRLLFDEVRR